MRNATSAPDLECRHHLQSFGTQTYGVKVMASESKKPIYVANVVAKRDGKEFWTRVGSVFENGNEAHPFTLLLNPVSRSARRSSSRCRKPRRKRKLPNATLANSRTPQSCGLPARVIPALTGGDFLSSALLWFEPISRIWLHNQRRPSRRNSSRSGDTACCSSSSGLPCFCSGSDFFIPPLADKKSRPRLQT